MTLKRRSLAHFCGVFAGAWGILAGLDAVASGPVGLADGTGKWIGACVIIAVLAISSLPLGLVLRFLIGKLHLNPQFGAILGGVAAGLMLIPMLHPAHNPSIAIGTHTFELLFVHAGAGVLGGYTWWLIERPLNSAGPSS